MQTTHAPTLNPTRAPTSTTPDTSSTRPLQTKRGCGNELDPLPGKTHTKTYNLIPFREIRTSNLIPFGWRYQKRCFRPQLTFIHPKNTPGAPVTLSPCLPIPPLLAPLPTDHLLTSPRHQPRNHFLSRPRSTRPNQAHLLRSSTRNFANSCSKGCGIPWLT